MQTEVLQEFIVVAKYSNFRKAAEELHMSQSALSSHIASLEREMGVTLFERNGKARLTPAGASFYVRAKQILKLLDDSIQEAKEAATRAQPVMVQMFGQEDSALEKHLMSIKTPFRIIPRDIKQTILGPLKSGEVDIVVSPAVPDIIKHDESLSRSAVKSLPIGKAEFSYLVSSSSLLAKKDSLSLDDLRNSDNLIPFGNVCDWFEYIFPEFYGEDLGINLVQDPAMPMGSDCIPLCDLGERIMPIYRGVAHHSSQNRSDLVAIDKLEGESLESMEYLAWRADNPNPNVQAFVDEVHALVGDVQDERAAQAASNTQSAQ